jgi:hypothetical protein
MEIGSLRKPLVVVQERDIERSRDGLLAPLKGVVPMGLTAADGIGCSEAAESKL